MNKKVVIGMIIFAVIGLVILVLLSTSKKKKEIKKIRDAVAKGVAESGEPSTRDILRGVGTLPAYDEPAKKFAKQIYDAKGFWNDDEEAIYNALSGKSIYQINTIDKMFQNKYGQDLEDFFKEILNEEERKKVNTIINSAKRKA